MTDPKSEPLVVCDHEHVPHESGHHTGGAKYNPCFNPRAAVPWPVAVTEERLREENARLRAVRDALYYGADAEGVGANKPQWWDCMNCDTQLFDGPGKVIKTGCAACLPLRVALLAMPPAPPASPASAVVSKAPPATGADEAERTVHETLMLALRAADDLCFECDGVLATRAPSRATYNRAFDTIKAALDLAARIRALKTASGAEGQPPAAQAGKEE